MHMPQIVTSREVRSADTRRNLTGYLTLAPAPGQTMAERADGPPPLTASRLADLGCQLPGPASGAQACDLPVCGCSAQPAAGACSRISAEMSAMRRRESRARLRRT